MTELEQFLAMLKRAEIDADVSDDALNNGGCYETATVVRVNHGYQAHFEAEFDKNGNLLTMGQWEDM